MRRLIFIFLAIGIFACQDRDKVDPQIASTFSVKNNGADWSGPASFLLDQATDTLIIFGSTKKPEAQIVLKIKFQGPGQYSLARNQAYYETTIGGDVQISEYKFAPHASGQLVITKYDPTTRYLEGNFQLTLTKHYAYLASAAETLNFTDGTFKGKIRD